MAIPSEAPEAIEQDGVDSDWLLTADRAEQKYLLAPPDATGLARLVTAKLAEHRFRGPDATILPGGRQYATTIYFDTPSRDLYRAATETASHLKLRAREYYSLHPSLTELATDPRQLVRYFPVLWLELKYRDESKVQKRRIAIPKRDLPAFFGSGAVSPEMMELARPSYGAEAVAVLSDVAGLCARFEESLGADCVVSYRRSAWQDEAGTLRVTLDRDVAFFRPPTDLWTRDFALVREGLGEPVSDLELCVLEVKARADVPRWLREALAASAAHPAPFSKFIAASRAVHG